MLNQPTSALKVGFESFAVLKSVWRSKRTFTPSLFHFYPSIPRLSWLSRPSALHWPFSSRVWKNKLRRKGQEQRTASSNTEERRADVLPAAWAFALIMDVWCRPFTCRLNFFPRQRLDICLLPWNAEGQCQSSARSTAKTWGIPMLWMLRTSHSCQLPHVRIPHT